MFIHTKQHKQKFRTKSVKICLCCFVIFSRHTTPHGTVQQIIGKLGALGAAYLSFEAFENMGREFVAGAFEKMDARESMGIGRILGLDNGTIQLLQGGKKSVEELILREKELGVYTKRDAEIAEKFNGIMDDFKQSVRSIFSVAFRPLFEWLTKLLEKGTEITRFLNQHQPFLQAFFAVLAVVITTKLIPAFKSLAKTILANPLTKVIVIIAAIAAVIDDLVTYAQGGNSAFKGLWDAIFGSPKGAMNAYKSVKNSVTEVVRAAKIGWAELKSTWNGFVEKISAKWHGFLDTWNGVLNSIDAALTDFINGFAAVWNAAWSGFPEIVSTVMSAISGIWNTTLNAMDAAIAAAVGFITKVWNGITSVFSSVADAVRDVWNTLFDWLAEKFGWFTDKAETIGNIAEAIKKRVNKADNKAETPAIHKGSASGGNHTTTTNSNITIQNIDVQTQATDAKGIAGGIGGALKDDLNKRIVANAQTGVNQKG